MRLQLKLGVKASCCSYWRVFFRHYGQPSDSMGYILQASDYAMVLVEFSAKGMNLENVHIHPSEVHRLLNENLLNEGSYLL